MFGKKFIIIWLVFCVLAAILVIGCSAPRPLESQVPLPPLSSMLNERPALQPLFYQQDTSSSIPTKRKILTLREEMQRYEYRQSNTENRIDSVAKELSLVKTEVEVLKNSVSGTFEPKSTAKSGIQAKKRHEDNEILSDEVASKFPAKQISKQIVKETTSKEIITKKSIA